MPPMRIAPLLAAALLLAATPARAEEPVPAPPTGTAWLVSGALLGAAGFADLATAPLCRLSAIRSTAQGACIGTSVASGVVLAGIGVPLLVLGVQKRTAWLRSVTVVPSATGAAVSYTRSW